MKKIFLTVLLVSSISTFSQFKISGYFDGGIGLNYQFSENFQTELRINDNLGIDFISELSFLYKFANKEKYNFNTGVGISSFPFSNLEIESIFIPIQLEITPFKEVENFGFVIETAYHFSTPNEGIRNTIGIRYIFK
jgi:hypothetical protein